MSALMAMLVRLPRWLWAAAGGAACLALVWGWHLREVHLAHAAGAAEQAALDRASHEREAAQAAAMQAQLVRELAVAQAAISRGVEHGLAVDFADLDRRHDDIRLRWAAARAAGAAGGGGTTAVSHATGPDDDAACAARGWVAFDVAAAAAHAADAAIAKDDAWISWARAQQAVWPD